MRRGLFLVVLLAACQRQPAGGGPRGPVQEGRVLLEQGQLDAALAKLAQAPNDADSLYYQGLVWARKAAAAPPPTPVPTTSPAPRGASPPPEAEFKAEEVQALGLFDRAIAARPPHPLAHIAIGELLAPHAIRRHQLEQEARKRPGHRPGRRESPPPEEPDYSVDRILGEFQKGLSGATSKAAAESLVRFAVAVDRMDAAQAAHEKLIEANKTDPQALIDYGDFLARDKKDPEAAVEQYKTAMVWHPEDETTKGKIADLYLAMAEDHYARHEYALAEARYREAEKFITDRSSARGARLRDGQGRLGQIRPQR
jgi:tetratricopeptide (TPR) repeat protein